MVKRFQSKDAIKYWKEEEGNRLDQLKEQQEKHLGEFHEQLEIHEQLEKVETEQGTAALEGNVTMGKERKKYFRRKGTKSIKGNIRILKKLIPEISITKEKIQ